MYSVNDFVTYNIEMVTLYQNHKKRTFISVKTNVRLN